MENNDVIEIDNTTPAKIVAFDPALYRSVGTADRREKWKAFTASPDFLETLLEYIGSGGTVPELAETWQVPDGWIVAYLTSTPEIKARYDGSALIRNEWYVQRILGELRKIGTVNVSELLSDDGSLKPVSEWPKECSAALAGIEIKELFDTDGNKTGEIKKVKFTDRLKALELLGKQSGMFKEVKIIEGKITLEALVAEAGREVLPESPPVKIVDAQ